MDTKLTLHVISGVLALGVIATSLIQLTSGGNSQELRVLVTLLAICLIGTNVALATLGSAFSWVLVVLWIFVATMNVIALL